GPDVARLAAPAPGPLAPVEGAAPDDGRLRPVRRGMSPDRRDRTSGPCSTARALRHRPAAGGPRPRRPGRRPGSSGKPPFGPRPARPITAGEPLGRPLVKRVSTG